MDIGYCTNIQDGAVLHGDPDRPLVIGDYVTIGHRAVVHCAEIGDRCLIGMGAILLEGVKIGAGSIVGAGAVVTKNVPAGVVVAGVPAKIVRELSEQDRQKAIAHAENYYQLSLLHN
jgi:carbonic anhydrase/acetyltransferase-like protein (isoleucine patch superfamily)